MTSAIAHTHSFGTPCHPRCRRWGMADGQSDWMLLDHRWDDSWTGCEHCGTPIKRVYLIENDATGRRLQVGKNCLSKFGIKS